MVDRRTVMVAARVTPEEHAAWQAKAEAAGVSPSRLLRQAMARTRTSSGYQVIVGTPADAHLPRRVRSRTRA